MRYIALATDYDGTLASNGRVDTPTMQALQRLKNSGRRLILVTGRELEDLTETFADIGICEFVVAENGAVLYEPSSKQEWVLATGPPREFKEALRAKGVPASFGRVIVGTREPHETAVLEAIKQLGLELQVIFNKGAVMVLPEGVNKATGLTAALERLQLSPHNVVAVGDAENDHSFLRLCECSAAVGNALPMLKQTADIVTSADQGRGVAELIDRIVGSDLGEVSPHLKRRKVLLGFGDDGSEVTLDPFDSRLLIAGSSGAGKSTIVFGLMERLADRGYQFCLVDPEGDYLSMAGAVRLGDPDHAPSYDEIEQVLADPDRSVVVNLLGIRLKDRPEYFEGLISRLAELKARTARPHWLVVDEAHHLMPQARNTTETVLPKTLGGLVLITVHADLLNRAATSSINAALVVGEKPGRTIQGLATAAGFAPVSLPDIELEPGQGIAWFPTKDQGPFRVRIVPPRSEHNRHHRKYAEGTLGEDRSFFFRGPDDRLNLKAVNLMRFVELAEGVDDETWLHHLHRNDYSSWFREGIKDAGLAANAERVEADKTLGPAESRDLIVQAVEAAYTLPAGEESGTRTD